MAAATRHNAREMLLTTALATAALARFEFSQMHMGVAVRLTLFAPERAMAERAGRAAFARFAEVDSMMSDYQDQSELNRLCRRAGSGPVAVSPELFEVLHFAYQVSVL